MLQHALGLRKAVNGSYFALFHSIICRKLQCKRKAKFLPEELVITQKLESKMSQTQSEIPDSPTDSHTKHTHELYPLQNLRKLQSRFFSVKLVQ